MPRATGLALEQDAKHHTRFVTSVFGKNVGAMLFGYQFRDVQAKTKMNLSAAGTIRRHGREQLHEVVRCEQGPVVFDIHLYKVFFLLDRNAHSSILGAKAGRVVHELVEHLLQS